jgi:hypothetical protein
MAAILTDRIGKASMKSHASLTGGTRLAFTLPNGPPALNLLMNSRNGRALQKSRIRIQEAIQSFQQGIGPLNLTFPDDKDRPAHLAQSGTHRCVPLLISEELRLPVLNTRSWQSSGAASRMHVPEASVDKNCFGSLRKDDVGATRQIGSMQGEAISAPMKETSDLPLGLRVLAFDAPHVLASALRRYVVHPRSPFFRCHRATLIPTPIFGLVDRSEAPMST